MEWGGWYPGQPSPASLEGLGLSVAWRNSENSQALLASQDKCRSFLLPTVAKEAPTFSAATSVLLMGTPSSMVPGGPEQAESTKQVPAHK